jgi:outer membrane protein assembly factor BamB
MTTALPLRLWPGVALAIIVLVVRFAAPLVIADGMAIALLGSVAGAVAIIAWWLLFSRAPWGERIIALVVLAAGIAAARLVVHESVRGGMMGMMLPVMAVPWAALALVAAVTATRRRPTGQRRAAMAVAILLVCGVWTMLRTDGITGQGSSQLAWRWTPTAEERLLAQAEPEPVASTGTATAPSDTPAAPAVAPAAPAAEEGPAPADTATVETAAPSPASPERSRRAADDEGTVSWPGFRGAGRDSVVHGVRIATDWAASPPVELWRRQVGPGWSSFAVAGDVFYTQEQRGDDEVVTAYRLTTGEPVWRHRDAARFYESNGGAGPRGTPTVSRGRVYTFGATGILNALDAATGNVLWSRNAASDTNTRTPDWGFSSSPLVAGDLVIVAVDATLVAYDARSGQQRWVGPTHTGSYSSPHLVAIDGVEQVLLLGGSGVTSLDPATGTLLWEHAARGVVIVQPALTADGDVLVTVAGGTGSAGVRRLALSRGGSGWTVEERWTSNGLKPYFNDFVVHKGHAYGFDGSILASVDLADGQRKWKGGRYGNGQLVLLADQDILLVLSEEGELALVSATTDQFRELARVPALEGKTWNHPVLVGDVLLVRNGEEMAAFRLARAGR